MADLVAQGEKPEDHWRKLLSAETIILGREQECKWEAKWDARISRRHASLTWKNNRLHVERLREGMNPIRVQGQALDAFSVGPGESFVIGTTQFTVVDVAELSCSAGELEKVRYGPSAADRMEAVARLPALMRYTLSEKEFEKSVLEVLLEGIPGAAGAALVSINANASEVKVHAEAARPGVTVNVQPSRRLAREAIRTKRQPVIHSWAGEPSSGAPAHSIAQTGYDCAICAPLTHNPGWALYIVGRAAKGTRQEEDLKFAGLVADIYDQLRQVRDLQKRRKLLEGFMSPKVKHFLSDLRNQNVGDILKAKTCAITVLFCDLRGFSRMSEQEDDLSALCDRVTEALRVMTRNIIAEDGVIGDFQGDAAMGFWGWPEQTDDQVQRAAKAALGILNEFKQVRQIPNHALAEFACGIGIAHGPGIAGRLGTLDQFKISVFSPFANLASRLEGMTKHFGVPILLDENAAQKLEAVDSRHLRMRRLARVRPFGMTRTTVIHELLPPSHEEDALSESVLADFDAAVTGFFAGDWTWSRKLLAGWAAVDRPSKVLLDYIDSHPVPSNPWDGVMAMDKK